MDGLRDRSRRRCTILIRSRRAGGSRGSRSASATPTWGAPKLRALFRRDFPDQPLAGREHRRRVAAAQRTDVARKRKRTSRRATEPLPTPALPTPSGAPITKAGFAPPISRASIPHLDRRLQPLPAALPGAGRGRPRAHQTGHRGGLARIRSAAAHPHRQRPALRHQR